jgi:NitT/TauT family transport system substrate-binding protein
MKEPMVRLKPVLLSSLVLLCGVCAASAQEHTVRIGIARAFASVATMISIEKGYYRELGIKVEVQEIDSSANALALLAQNRLQIVEGGISAGFFNGLEKDLPMAIVTDRVTSPIHHKLLIRPDLKDRIKTVADLKGKVIASNAQGSVTTYEVGKILETAGLSLKDIEIKILPFSQMGVALANKAVDGALVISPWNAQFVEQGLGVVFADPDDYVKPAPLTIAVSFINTEWAAKNPELVRNYFVAYLRGVREYCQAYHGGPNRREVIDIAVRSGAEARPEVINKIPWAARSPDGRINIESLLDMQKYYVKAGLSQKEFPPERLVDRSVVDHAVQKLGPFVVQNKDSKLPGCR